MRVLAVHRMVTASRVCASVRVWARGSEHRYVFLAFFALDVLYLTQLLFYAFTYREYCGRGLAPVAYRLIPVIVLQLAAEAFIVLEARGSHTHSVPAPALCHGVWLCMHTLLTNGCVCTTWYR